MSIELIQQTTVPAIVLNKLHIDQFLLNIDRSTGAYKLRVSGGDYGVGIDGINIYGTTNYNVNTDDFLPELITTAITTGECIDAADFMGQLTAARNNINVNKPSLAESMAQFENVIKNIFNVTNEADVLGILE